MATTGYAQVLEKPEEPGYGDPIVVVTLLIGPRAVATGAAWPGRAVQEAKRLAREFGLKGWHMKARDFDFVPGGIDTQMRYLEPRRIKRYGHR